MKIALYIDPYISPRSTFYTKILLQQELKAVGHQLDIFIPRLELPNRQIDQCYVDPEFARQHRWNVQWLTDVPDATMDQYDALLVINIWNKKWKNGIDCRKLVSQSFQLAQKPVISIKNDTTMEHRFINKYIIYGVNSTYQLKIRPRWRLPMKARTFILPQISSYHHPKPDALSRTQFYDKYGLNKAHNLIIFFGGAFKKWKPNNLMYETRSIRWFYQNLASIDQYVQTLGYKLIIKSHRRDNKTMIENGWSYTGLVIIDQEDTYEAIQYAKRAISCYTSMVYELYLYQLPVLELQHGIYYPGWLSDLARNKVLNEEPANYNGIDSILATSTGVPLANYRRGRDLIFGTITNYALLENNWRLILQQFITQSFNINDFVYRHNHPIYGNSFQVEMKHIAQALVKQINQFIPIDIPIEPINVPSAPSTTTLTTTTTIATIQTTTTCVSETDKVKHVSSRSYRDFIMNKKQRKEERKTRLLIDQIITVAQKKLRFDWKFYLNKYPDLHQAGINNAKLAKDHWQSFGIREGRIGHQKYVKIKKNFDLDQYLEKYPILATIDHHLVWIHSVCSKKK